MYMRSYILILIFISSSLMAYSQRRMSDKRSIIAVMKQTEDGFDNYYKLKDGSRVGVDSIYLFDMTPDCESEGYIRFRDRVTEKIGMFDGNGKVAIPAEYNVMTPFINGMSVVIKDGQREYWGANDGRHWNWVGTEWLIDKDNRILIKDFSYSKTIDFFSLQQEDAPSKDTCRVSFLGVNGKYYTFVDMKKEFEQWFKKEILSDLSKERLMKHCYRDVYSYKMKKGWMAEERRKYINDEFTFIKERLLNLNNDNAESFISMDDLNWFIYKKREFRKYFNECGEAMTYKYPVMSVILTHGTKDKHTQDVFTFLRTDEGYKLLAVMLR